MLMFCKCFVLRSIAKGAHLNRNFFGKFQRHEQSINSWWVSSSPVWFGLVCCCGCPGGKLDRNRGVTVNISRRATRPWQRLKSRIGDSDGCRPKTRMDRKRRTSWPARLAIMLPVMYEQHLGLYTAFNWDLLLTRFALHGRAVWVKGGHIDQQSFVKPNRALSHVRCETIDKRASRPRYLDGATRKEQQHLIDSEPPANERT